jgi:hypothetical protein
MLRSTFKGVALGSATALGLLYVSNPQSSIHKSLVLPLLHKLSPEDSHRLAILAASWGLSPRDNFPDDPRLSTTLFGKEVSNPIGLAAGFDKNGEAVDAMFGIGFGLVEIGSVTPEPQAGNAKPRMFRLEQDAAVINRYVLYVIPTLYFIAMDSIHRGLRLYVIDYGIESSRFLNGILFCRRMKPWNTLLVLSVMYSLIDC